jgi:hypothetical protein
VKVTCVVLPPGVRAVVAFVAVTVSGSLLEVVPNAMELGKDEPAPFPPTVGFVTVKPHCEEFAAGVWVIPTVIDVPGTTSVVPGVIVTPVQPPKPLKPTVAPTWKPAPASVTVSFVLAVTFGKAEGVTLVIELPVTVKALGNVTVPPSGFVTTTLYEPGLAVIRLLTPFSRVRLKPRLVELLYVTVPTCSVVAFEVFTKATVGGGPLSKPTPDNVSAIVGGVIWVEPVVVLSVVTVGAEVTVMAPGSV